jgi:hypothetical protein
MMFFRCCSLLLLLGGVNARTAAGADEPLEGQLIGRAWAGHPVSFALLTTGGRQFVAYFDEERRITVAARKLEEETWIHVRPEGRWLESRQRASNITGWDSHNYLTLAVDREGCVHLAGNMHVDPLIYYRSRRPYDLTSLERIDCMTGDRETACTYPVFFKNAAGDLFFRYRDGSSGNGSDLYNRYDPATHTWRRLLDTALLEGEGRRNAYALNPTLGPDGRFHLVWMWRDTPDCATNHTLSYARSADFLQWEDHLGRPIPLPITLTRGEVIDAARPHEGLINMTFNLGFDAEKSPVVVYHRYDAQGRSQVYAARPGDNGWNIHRLSAWDFRWQFQGTGSITAEVELGPPQLTADGFLLVPYSTLKTGNGCWRLRASDLMTVGQLPAAPSPLPARLLKPLSPYPGMEVSTRLNSENHTCYVLRWETLPRNRDQPRPEAPPPTELRLYRVADTGGEFLLPVGS